MFSVVEKQRHSSYLAKVTQTTVDLCAYPKMWDEILTSTKSMTSAGLGRYSYS